MISYSGIFAVTYITVQIVTFTECDPFKNYWTVLPDPGIVFPNLFVLHLLFVYVGYSNKYRHMLSSTASIDRARYVFFWKIVSMSYL